MIQAVGVSTSVQSFTQKAKQDGVDFSSIVASIVETEERTQTSVDDIASEYDVRNMTFEQLTEVANKLYEAGEIQVKDLMLMTFDFGRATEYVKAIGHPQTSANFTMYETAEQNGQRDWIAEFQARAAKNRKYGNLIGDANNSKIVAILQRLERA